MLTNREFHLQTGNLAYKTGFSFTKRDSWVTKGILGLLFTPVEKFRNDFKSIVWQNIRQYGMPVKNGVYQLIQYLEVNNIRYAVATSNDRAMALELLEAADLRGVFEYMVCGDEVEHGKPFPDIYQKAADMLGVNIKHTLVIEDSYNGIRAGHAAGASVIMVPDLVQPTDEIRQMTDYVVSDLGKVISCISNF